MRQAQIRPFNPFDEFERLLSDFADLRSATHRMKLLLPSPEPDEFIEFLKLAVIGFLQHEKADQWSRTHTEFIKSRRAGDLSDEGLDWYEEFVPSVAAFSCLALGALQGLYSQGRIDALAVLHGEWLLAGFTSLEMQRIQKQYEAGANR